MEDGTMAEPSGMQETAVSTAASAASEGHSRVRLSKAEKRALKSERLHKRRLEWRQRQRESHKRVVAQRQADREAKLAAMPEDERAAFEGSEKAMRDRLYEERVAQTARVDAALAGGLRVAVDLSYGGCMSDKERTSLSRQLARMWGLNRRAPSPVSLHLTGLGVCPASCLPPDDVHLSWKVHNVEEDVVAHFGVERLVFLSPDASEVLTELDPAKVYVIGGLVDSSVQKHTSLERASLAAATSARLPLAEHATVNHGRIPLTLTAVLEILLGVHHDGDWAGAIQRAVPLRQAARPLDESRAVRRAASRAARTATWGTREGGQAVRPAPSQEAGGGSGESGEEEEEGEEEGEEGMRSFDDWGEEAGPSS